MNVNAEYQKKLLKRWGPVLESGKTKIASVRDKLMVGQLLENTFKEYRKAGYFTEATNTVKPGVTPNGAYDVSKGVMMANDYILPNVVMPTLRRIFPALIAHELVSVQPMTGPVGYALALRVLGPNGGNKAYDSQKNFEYGFEATVGTTGNKKDSEDEFSRLGVEGFARGVSEAEGFGADPVFGRFGASGVPGSYPMAAIKFVKSAVTADERKLGSEWSPEFGEDLEAMHGIDIESEMIEICSFQIGEEIDQEIVNNMFNAGKAFGYGTWTASKSDGLDQMGRIATLLTAVTKAANDIAVTTRRGTGNFVIASNNVSSVLQQLGSQKLVSDGKTMPSVPASSQGALAKQGLINDGRQLLVRDTYSKVDYALVGYKGTQTGDSGIIYCPYVPVTLVKTIDPYTLSTRIGARTRYGMLNNPYDAKNFYRLLKVDFEGTYGGVTADRTFFGTADPVVIAQSVSDKLADQLGGEADGGGMGGAPAPKKADPAPVAPIKK